MSVVIFEHRTKDYNMRRIFGVSGQNKFRLTRISDFKSGARNAGDRARDVQNWISAEQHYKRHLKTKPDDTAIWVQLGHALKEQGKILAAEDAYRQATVVQPQDPDAYLHLGHILKIQMKRVEAQVAFARSLELAPSKAVFEEMSLIAGKNKASKVLAQRVTPNTVYFEIDDLLGWLSAHKTLSGIQRVQVGILRSILTDVLYTVDDQYAFVRTRDDSGSYWKIWPSDLHDILVCASAKEFDQSELFRLLNRAEQAAVAVTPSKGQCYIILGAFWGFNGDASRYSRLKRAGVSTGIYIYDLIPITHPEYCDAGLVSAFALSLGDGLAVFDFILTISEFTAQDVRRHIESLDLRRIPVEAVPLAHLLNEQLPAPSSHEWTENISALQDRRFVLSVSTIEARKNHSYLVMAWKLMLDEGLDPPDLVFIGRFGWRVNDFMEQLKATDFLGGRIHVLHDLPDAELETLYRHCQFTAFPSFVEGWGLPVGESLAHGRPCIASNSSSIPEVGGELVDYIDPYNVRSGVEAFRRMSFDSAYRDARAQQIQTDFVPRTWRDVTVNLLDAIGRHRQTPWPGNLDPILLPGELFFPSELRVGHAVSSAYSRRPLRPVLAESWYAAEHFGVWMRGTTGLLRFQTKLEPDTEIVIYLKLAGVSWAANQIVSISTGPNEATALPDLDGPVLVPSIEFPRRVQVELVRRQITRSPFLMRVHSKVLASRSVSLRLDVKGLPLPQDPEEQRKLSVGLVGFAYAERSDHELCADIAEYLAIEA